MLFFAFWLFFITFTESGRVYGCGANGESQLGITSEDSQNVNSPQVLEKLPEVRYKVLSAGTDHSLALTGKYLNITVYYICKFQSE